jgi:hypothetical protein
MPRIHKLTEYAAFGEVSYDLTDGLEVTLGERWSRLEFGWHVRELFSDTPLDADYSFSTVPFTRGAARSRGGSD